MIFQQNICIHKPTSKRILKKPHHIKCYNIQISKQNNPMCQYLDMDESQDYIDDDYIIFGRRHNFEGKVWNYGITLPGVVIKGLFK